MSARGSWLNPTYICWDLNACPPPKDADPFLVSLTIKSAARMQGFYGRSQIRIYDSNQTTDSSISLPDYADAGFIINTLDDESEKFTKMLMDMLLWALNSRKVINFIVLTRISHETEHLMRGLLSAKERSCHAYLALPDWSIPIGLTGIKTVHRETHLYLKLTDFAPGHNEIQVWRCPTLLEDIGKDEEEEAKEEAKEEEAKEEDKEEAKDKEKKVEEDDHHEDVIEGGLEPISFSMDRNSTGVFWDVEDYPLPAQASLSTFYENIKDSLKCKGCNGDVVIWAYVPDYMMDEYQQMAERFRDQGLEADKFFFVPKVPRDKYSRLNMMTVDLLLWAIDNPCVPKVLLISKDMERRTPFPLLLGGLGMRGYTVFLAMPDGDDVAPEEAADVIVLPWKDLSPRIG